MAGVDFGAWLAKKYEILQQNANTNAAEVEQRDRAATMQYGVGGVFDRGQTAETKRKQMELEQDTYKFNEELPLKKMETKAKVGLFGAQAANLGSETRWNTATMPLYLKAQEIENDAREKAIRGLEGSKSFEDINIPRPQFATPRETYLSSDGGGSEVYFDSDIKKQKRRLQWGN